MVVLQKLQVVISGHGLTCVAEVINRPWVVALLGSPASLPRLDKAVSLQGTSGSSQGSSQDCDGHW